jgi:methane monooxygenase component D
VQLTTNGDAIAGSNPSNASEAVLLHADERYHAYGQDLEYMWRWEIHRDGEFVQEGCSLSESSAREAVSHVVAFFNTQDVARAAPGGDTDEIKKLLHEAGLGAPVVRDAGADGV